MSKLYAQMAVDGRWQNKVTRRSHRKATSQLASWHGAIETTIWLDEDNQIRFQVSQIPWKGVGKSKLLKEGKLT